MTEGAGSKRSPWMLASVIVGEGSTEAALVVEDHFYAFDAHPSARRLIGREGPTTIFEILQRIFGWAWPTSPTCGRTLGIPCTILRLIILGLRRFAEGFVPEITSLVHSIAMCAPFTFVHGNCRRAET